MLVIEFLLPEPNESSPAWLMDLLMLVGCHGRERSAEEFATPVRGRWAYVQRTTPPSTATRCSRPVRT